MNLQGNDALDKANKLFEFMETKPKVDSYSNVESIHLAHDGKHYGIVKENATYVLKVSDKVNPTLAEDFDYINGVQNKSKYSKNSYNDVVKMFNLMDIEYSRVHGQALMTEALEEKKYVISAKKKSNNQQPVDGFGGEEIGNIGGEEPAMDGEGMPMDDEFPADDMSGQDMGDEASESPDDYADVDPDDLDTEDPKKMIQKLSGKLAYELREFDDEDEYSDTAKFAMSMATSALQADKMSEEDKNAIEKKIDSKFDASEETKGDEFPQGEEMGGEEDEITNEPEDVEEQGLEETLLALDNIHMKVGSFAIDEPMMERVVLTKEQFFSALNEGLIFEAQDPLKTWANKLASMYNSGKIDKMELFQIIKNNIEDHNYKLGDDGLAYDLNTAFENAVGDTDSVDGTTLMNIITDALPKPAYDVSDDDIYFEIDETLDEDIYFEEDEPKSADSIKSLDFDGLKQMVTQYAKEVAAERKNKTTSRPWAANFVGNLMKFFKYIEKPLISVDYDIKYNLKQLYKNPNSRDHFAKLLNAFDNLDNIDTALYDLSHYKNNFWMKKMNTEGDDQLGKQIVAKIDDLYDEFKVIKKRYLDEEDYWEYVTDRNQEVETTYGVKRESEDDADYNLYDVEPDDLLFDLDEDDDLGDEDILFDIEEEMDENAYSESPKKIKNKKYTQNYFGMDVGRVVGDDDAADYILEDDAEDAPEDFEFGKIHVKKQEPRNPFKYKS
jgi:hypothetical protein